MPPAHPALRKYRLDYRPGTTSFRFRQSLMRSFSEPGVSGLALRKFREADTPQSRGKPEDGPKDRTLDRTG
jgi:hypothetical protein